MRLVHLAVLLAACGVVGRTASSVVESSLWPPVGAAARTAPPTTRDDAPALDTGHLASLLHLEPKPPAATELPLTLLGTLAPTFAAVVERGTGAVHTVSVGDVLAGLEVVAITRAEVLVRRDGQLARLSSARSTVPATSAAVSVTIARSELVRAAGDLSSLARLVRVVPRVVDGRLEGFTLHGASRVPLLVQAGLQDGDLVRRINGVDTSRPDQLVGLLGALGTLPRVDLELVRGGATVHHAVALQ